MADIRFKYGLDSNFKDIDKTKEWEGTIFLSQVTKEINSTQTPYKSHLYFLDSNKNMLNIVPRLLDVENGGTGRTTLELDQVLLGNGIEPVKFRPITDFLTANTDYTLNDTNNLITERTIGHWNGEFDEQTLDGSGNITTVKKYYLTKLGVINTGTWEANVIKSIYGGTGNNSYTKNRLIYTKENNASEIQLLSSNHFIDDNKIIFYYNPDKEDTIYKNKDELNKEFKFLVDGTVQFITSDDYNSIVKFTDGQLIIEQQNRSPINKVLDTRDITPTLVFYNSADDRKGILKWGRIADHSIDILAFLSDSTDFALSTPKLEVNTLSHFNSEKDTRHNVLHFLDENDNVRVVLNGQGSTFITSGSTSFTEDKDLSESEEKQKNLYLASNDKIYFYINNNDEDTKSLKPEHFIVLDQGKALYPDINATGELGTNTNNWNAIKALNLISNTNLNIAATAKDGILDSGNIHISADTDKLINLNSDSYITNYKDLILTGDIVYHNLNENFSYKHSVIRFLPGNTLRDGISFGGGGAIAIESGNLNFLEPRLFLDSNTGSLINGNSEQDRTPEQDGSIYIASEDKIYIYPSRSSTGNQALINYLIIDNKVIQPDLDNKWELGAYSYNWNNLYTRAITANNNLIIKSGIRGGTTPQTGNINITAGDVSNITLTGDLIKIVGDLYLYNSIKYHNNNNPLTMIQFSDGTANGAGITVGGKGSVFIAAGESINNTSLGVQSGNYDAMYLASDGDIELFTNAQGSESKKTVLDSDGNFQLMNVHRGYFLTDSAGNQYAGIYNNATNLWIGCKGNNTYHHRGNTFISAGTDESGNGHSTIYISIPDSTNENGHINHKAFHEGMNILPRTTNTYSIGSSSYRWKGLYLNGFTIDGNGRITNDILPTTSNTYNIGNTTYKWKTLYLNNFTIGQGTIKNSVDANVTCAYIETPGNAYIALGGPSTTYVFAGGDNKIGLGHANVRWKGLWTYGFTIDANGRINNNILPTADAKFSLGSSSYKWNALYMPNLTISNKGEVEITHSNADNTWDSGYVRITGKNSHFTVTTSNAYELSLLMGAGGKNRGLYSRYYNTATKKWTDGAWRFYVNASDNTVISGDSTVTITSVLVAQEGATFVSNGLNINYLNSKDIKEGFSINPTFKHNATKVAALGTETYPWRIGYIDEIVIEKGTVNNVKITSDKRFKTLEKDEILETSLKIYDALTPVCYRYKNIKQQEDFDYSTHIGFFAQDVEQIIEEYGLNSEDYSLVQKSVLSKECPQEIRDICTDGYRYYIDYNNLHGLHTIKNHQQDKKLFELENKNKELEEKIALLQNQIAMLIN